MRNKRNHTWLPLLGSLLLVVSLLWVSLHTLNAAATQPTAPTALAQSVAPAIKAPTDTDWCVAGSFQGWNNSSTPLYDDGTNGDLIAGDGVYSLDYTFATPGREEFKAVECGIWDNAFPSDNAWVVTDQADQTVKLTFDTNDYSGNAGAAFLPTQNIVNVWGDALPTSFTVVGPWQGWNNTAVTTTMSNEGHGWHRLVYQFATAGSYEAKISETDNWDNQFGADGRNKGAPTISFTTTQADQNVTFLLDGLNGRLIIALEDSTAGPWCLAGSFNGWSGDGFPMYDDGANGDLLGGDGLFSLDFTVPTSGTHEFKITACDWGTNFPGANAWAVTASDNQVVKFTFDANDHSADAGLTFYPAQHIVNARDDMPVSFTVVGPWQGWDNGSVDTTMTPIGYNVHILNYAFAAAGDYEAKATNTGGWAYQIGADGRSVNAPTIPFTVASDGDVVSFLFDGRTGRLAIFTPESLLPPIDLDLVRAPVTHPVQDEVFYFLLPDRFQNGDPSNDTGGIPGDEFDHGFLPSHKNFYHGGDLAGLTLTSTLDYLDNLGVSALWITPVFKNDVLEGSGTDVNSSYAAYHGYWIIDYEAIDPHLGTDQEFIDFVDAAHARGIKVYLDIVANHTGNLIDYLENQYSYRNKTDYPYRDASGVAFDDRDYVGTGTFPALDPAISFPYTPITTGVKNPDWLNNPIYYHNRGDSSFSGESSTYGDFFGLDDLFTEHPAVVMGFIDIFTNTIANYNIDGFRLDTVKHVNVEFWQEVIPTVMDYATNNGKPEFFMFGEVFDYSTPYLSTFTTQGGLPSVLDFQTQGYAYGFAIKSEATNNLQTHFANDDYYTDADSNAYQLANFISNHDIGRFGGFIRNELGGAPTDEWLARSELGHALMFFARGFPIVYYGDEQGFVSDGGDADAREDMLPSQVASYNDNDLIGTTATTADDNLDPNHPLYQTFADYATVYEAHLALRRGAQIHRYGQGSAGIYAFSRIERGEKVEYVVALNNATTAAAATFPVYTAHMGFTAVYPLTSTDVITSDGSSQLAVTVPPLSVAIYRANAALTTGQNEAISAAPDATFYAPTPDSVLNGRVEVGVNLSESNVFVEVNFAVKIGDGPYEYIGTDTNAPYRVFYDVSGIPDGTAVTFQAIVNDLNGDYKNNIVGAVVGEASSADEEYVIIHYHRFNDDYGDFSSSDFNDFWGLHLWGSALHPDEYNASWSEPRKFSGIDDYGAFVAMRLVDDTQLVNFIIHKGNDKDPGDGDRAFDPSVSREIWLVQGDWTIYTSRAEALGETLVHYNRPDATYTDWGLHMWQDGSPALTDWPTRELPSSYDSFGAVYSITTDVYPTLELTRGLNFIIHNGAGSQEPQRTYTPTINYEVWVNAAATDWYAQEGAATDVATIHYRRCLGDYGDYNSSDFNDFWGLHLWTGALTATNWTEPLKPIGQDDFGPVFAIPLQADAATLSYILHRGNLKDVPEDQSLDLAARGYEIWIVEGNDGANVLSAGVQFTNLPIAYNVAERVCAGVTIGNIERQSAYWLSENTIGWQPLLTADAVYLHAAPTGGLLLDDSGISGGAVYTLTRNGVITGDIAAKFPHLAGLPAWEIDPAAVDDVPDLLKGQIAVSAFAAGELVDATGLQIPGVLDDLYAASASSETLGVVWDGGTPTLNLWAPTAKAVTLHRFADADPATASVTYTMSLDADSGVWSYTGMSGWNGQYYLYEVEVYVHSTGQVEHNIVTDPYSFSLAMNSKRSQMVNLADPTLAPAGWDTLVKPPLVNPEDITVYEVHMRDFSVSDPLVPEEAWGTFKAFTYENSYGMQHLQALADAGLTHLHLLPVFDIATIDEDKSNWQEPDFTGLDMSPDSEDQQAAVTAVANLDAFNWGYDPFHYTVPEGSYSTVPTGTTRIVEFREMVQVLNENNLRVVMDVVYNHTNASGQNEKSVLDRIVPGYYHRLNSVGRVENSTCCENTASEHEMMEKLMIDSLVVWAKYYKVDAFRFDLMGHHMKENMLAVRAALDALTLEDDGVDGAAIYIYGEGWNFGEVANDARGVNATQLNMAGTGIGTFSDRLRDAVRGPSPFAGGLDLQNQGFANGLHYDPNGHPQGDTLARLLLLSDQIRIGLAGNLATYEFIDRNGNLVTGAQVDYNGQPTGYTLDPQEHIVYISKHDNQTLYDINAYAIPGSASMADHIRVQQVGLSIVSLSQGVPSFHAGSDMLRSKSLDRDGYNSGDWFNKLDFTYASNNWGVGLPVAEKNQENWFIMQPLLANPDLLPAQADIEYSAAWYQDWLAIRYSSPLFRLETAADVQARLTYANVGPTQIPGLIVMNLSDMVDGLDDLDPNHEWIVVLFNANDEAQTISSPTWAGLDLALHPVQMASVDDVVQQTTFDSATGTFVVPGRTTAVYILEEVTVYGVELSADAVALSGMPGEVVTYTLTLTNTGSASDSFTFSASGNTWDVTLPTTVTLDAGAATTVNVLVHIPADAAGGAMDDVTITATSLNDPNVTAAAALITLTTTANDVYGLLFTPASMAQTGLPGVTVSYTLSLTNTGNAADIFTFAATHDWEVTLPAPLPLNAGATAAVVIYVTIPAGAMGGASDMATITVTSTGDATVTGATTLTTTAANVYGLELTPAADGQTDAPGATVTYTLTLTNSGNAADTFNLSVNGHVWVVTLPSTVTVAAGDAVTLIVVVTIAADAVDGASDVVVVTAVSDGDPTQTASSTLTTTAETGIVYLYLPVIMKP